MKSEQQSQKTEYDPLKMTTWRLSHWILWALIGILGFALFLWQEACNVADSSWRSVPFDY